MTSLYHYYHCIITQNTHAAPGFYIGIRIYQLFDNFCFSTLNSYAKLAGWSVDLVTKGFQVLCQLVQDLECDEVSNTSSSGPEQVIPFADQLDIFGSYTPWQRIRMLIASIPLVDVLFTLLCSSYKKVCECVHNDSILYNICV